MFTGETYSERRWPNVPEFNTVFRDWKPEVSTVLLSIVWIAYDRFCTEVLTQVDCSQEDKDLERDITQLLEPKMHEVMSGFEPFFVQHGPYEHESSLGGSAQPPQYDIAFRLQCNPRIMWPLEAKLLRTSKRVAEYNNEIRSNFLTCRYSPFSSEAAMLGYLLGDDSDIAFKNIEEKGGWKLIPHPRFPDREHRTSNHVREVPEGRPYPTRFRLHHLIFRLCSG